MSDRSHATGLGEEAVVAASAAVPAAAGTVRRRGGLGWWIVRRLAAGVVVVLLVSVVVFAATQALPADPAEAILGRGATPDRIAALRAELGLERGLVQQYLDWIGGLLGADLGRSLAANVPVGELIGDRLVNSLVLLGLAGMISLPLAVLLGALSAVRRDGIADRLGLGVSLVLTAVPDFVIGMTLVMVFATSVLTILPAVALIPAGSSPLAHPDTLVLPVATLVLAVVPYLYRLVRASMIDVLESDYAQMARMKGMPRGVVMRRHALPNALVPTIQASALVLGYLLSGTILVEYVFRYPGLGSALADAISSRDLPVIQAITLIYAVAVVAFNLLADVLTVLVTPKLRTAGR